MTDSTSIDITEERNLLLEKFEDLTDDDDCSSIFDENAICLDNLSDSEFAELLRQHEENTARNAAKSKR